MANSPTDVPPQTCPACGTAVDIQNAEPLAPVACPNCGEKMRAQRTFDHFELVETLGAGGMGAVYKARDTRLDRLVALKLLRPELSANPEEAARLEQEARVTAAVNHPNVVHVYSTGTAHGQIYLVMELVGHGSLDDLMAQHGRLPEADVLRAGVQVAKGLQAAHQKGLIHRDVKPANILFSDAETAKIGDFGLAVAAGQQADAQKEIWGTPYYVAPERLNSEPEDFRSDIYSLGATLFHALAGKPPMEGDTNSAAELRQLKSHPPDLRKVAPDVSRETARIINKMLALKPENRFTSYGHLITQLERAARTLTGASGGAGQSKSPFLVWIVALVVVALAGGAFYFYRSRPGAETPGANQTSAEPSAPPVDMAALQQRYDAARRQLIDGKFDAAATALTRLATDARGQQPLLNWIRLQAGLAALLQGKTAPARDLFNEVERGGPYSSAKADNDLAKFFVETARTMAASGSVRAAAVTNANPQNADAFALLLYGIKDWTAREFDEAAALLQRFTESNPTGAFAWMADYKPLARKFLDDHRVYTEWKAAAPSDPHVALESARAAQKRLQLRGALADEMDAQVKRLAIQVERQDKAETDAKAAERQRLLAAETPAWEAALAEAQKKIAAYDFQGALTAIENVKLTEPSLQELQAAERKRAGWLVAWKTRLIADLKTGALRGPLTLGATAYDGASTANDSGITLRIGAYGGAPFKWQQFPPPTLLAMSSGFIRAGAPDVADRQWLAAAFAHATGQSEAARALAEAAAKAKPEYQKELPLLIPGGG